MGGFVQSLGGSYYLPLRSHTGLQAHKFPGSGTRMRSRPAVARWPVASARPLYNPSTHASNLWRKAGPIRNSISPRIRGHGRGLPHARHASPALTTVPTGPLGGLKLLYVGVIL